jgi:hypothetical protein
MHELASNKTKISNRLLHVRKIRKRWEDLANMSLRDAGREDIKVTKVSQKKFTQAKL